MNLENYTVQGLIEVLHKNAATINVNSRYYEPLKDVHKVAKELVKRIENLDKGDK